MSPRAGTSVRGTMWLSGEMRLSWAGVNIGANLKGTGELTIAKNVQGKLQKQQIRKK
jgi:hypothetical protein